MGVFGSFAQGSLALPSKDDKPVDMFGLLTSFLCSRAEDLLSNFLAALSQPDWLAGVGKLFRVCAAGQGKSCLITKRALCL